MRYLIVGCGNVGLELARRWNEAGHHVTGTTTSTARVAEIAAICARAVVLRGSDREAMARAAAASTRAWSSPARSRSAARAPPTRSRRPPR